MYINPLILVTLDDLNLTRRTPSTPRLHRAASDSSGISRAASTTTITTTSESGVSALDLTAQLLEDLFGR